MRTKILSAIVALLALALPAKAQNTYSNPVIRRDCPDPTVLDDRANTGYFYAYSTQSAKTGLMNRDNTSKEASTIINLPIYRSTNLIDWEFVADGFSKGRPEWLANSSIWAPDINYVDGKYVLYYALGIWANLFDTGSGVAVSDSPTGPFEDKGMVVGWKNIGTANSIDPNFYRAEDGRSYLFWGSFGPMGGIWIVELEHDGLKVKEGAKKKHVGADNLEGAYIHKRGDWYYLFASKGTCCEEEKSTYRIVVGRSKTITGPYRDPKGKKMTSLGYDYTILQAPDDKTFVGTGHDSQIITDDAGQDWMFYHTYWTGSSYHGRMLNLDRVLWSEDGWPYFENGTPSKEHERPIF